MKIAAVPILAMFLVGGLANAKAQPHADISTLSETEISIADVSSPDMPGKAYFAATIMAAPLPKLCTLIQDYPDYPNFMPNTERAEVVQVRPEFSLVDLTLKLPLGTIKKYRLRLQPSRGKDACVLRWKLIPRAELRPEETIADTSGYWRLSPYPDDAGKTTVEYFVYADPGYVPFGFHWIVDLLSKESLPQTLEALRRHAAK